MKIAVLPWLVLGISISTVVYFVFFKGRPEVLQEEN